MPNFPFKLLALTVTSTLFLTACGGGSSISDSFQVGNQNTTTDKAKVGVNALTTGELLSEPTNFKNLTANEIEQATLAIEPNSANAIGTPKCGVSVQYMHYDTLDAKGKPTDATGAVFVPTGDDPACQGERPIVLHAHGTATQHSYNFAEVGNKNNEAGLRATSMANIFAGQGFIVIAPNYAGFDKSKLNYHPYLNAKQQSKEMGDALKAGRTVLKKLTDSKVQDNGKLFLTGYSQGGHVALATARYFAEIQEPITALVPMSGPYAMGAFGDVVFGGNVMVGGTFFAPLMARSYQEQFGNIYEKPSDLFAPSHADEIVSLLPNKTMTDVQLIINQKLPESALFQKNTGNLVLDAISPADAKFSFGFSDNNYLLNNNYRLNYLADMQANPDNFVPYAKQLASVGTSNILPETAKSPMHPLRQALKANDLRNYLPNVPILLCGGNQDPMVFFDVNTTLTHGLWKNVYGKTGNNVFGMVDMDITATDDRVRYETKGLDTVRDNAVKAQTQAMQQAFSQNVATLKANAIVEAKANGATDEQAESLATANVLRRYHGMVAPYCMATARTFFEQF